MLVSEVVEEKQLLFTITITILAQLPWLLLIVVEIHFTHFWSGKQCLRFSGGNLNLD